MERLTEIGIKFGTDKADYHGFTEFYQAYAEKFQKPKLLEIGIYHGESLKMWNEFYNGKAIIIGVDTNIPSPFEEHNIHVIEGDILKQSTLDNLKNLVNNDLYDIIIDDGGHTMEQQQKTLLNLWDQLKPGGIFIIEDLHTSYNIDFNPDHTTSTLDILNSLIAETENGYQSSIYLSKEQIHKINQEIESAPICTYELSPGKYSITCVITKKNKKTVTISEEDFEDRVKNTPAAKPTRPNLPLSANAMGAINSLVDKLPDFTDPDINKNLSDILNEDYNGSKKDK